MVNPEKAQSVYRYFDLADAFVQIQVSDRETLEVVSSPGLNRASYRRMVIEACMPDFRGGLEAQLESLFPEDPLMVEDLLYQLCVEVNPSLDIHEVQLFVNPNGEPAPSTQIGSDAGHDDLEQLLTALQKRVRGLRRRLERGVLGQDEAIAAILAAISNAAVGLGERERPLASFMFTGRTGTGKTELARLLARELYGGRSAKPLVRIDCSEYALAHEHSKLIGSPPGYVGHEDGGQLTDAVASNPECVVLFDEVEKAHPRMHNLLLQILEDGALTDGKGRRVSFERAIVILTSNAGAQEMQAASNALGFERSSSLEKQSLRSITEGALERLFSPEFLGRIGVTVLFNELDPKVVEQIARKQLFELAHRGRQRGLRVAFTTAAARWVAERGFSPDYGARELRRVVQREIEPQLASMLLEKRVGANQIVRVRVTRGELAFEVED